jgi:hypothetical protein
MARRRKRRDGKFVMVEQHEFECPAYRTLSMDARALLLEFRYRYNGTSNCIPFSIREMRGRLNRSQAPVQRALDELIEKGWILPLRKGGFSCKKRLASEYALTNHPLPDRPDAPAPKTFMAWRQERKSTVPDVNTHGTRPKYRVTATTPPENPDSTDTKYRAPLGTKAHGTGREYTSTSTRAFAGPRLQTGAGANHARARRDVPPFVRWGMNSAATPEHQAKLAWLHVLANTPVERFGQS